MRLMALFLLCHALSAPALGADADTSFEAEQRVKAAYLYRFVSYIDWPPRSFENDNSPYVIGIVGAELVADELTRIAAAKTINGRALAVQRLRPGQPAAGVHMLFIGRTENERLDQWTRQVQGRPVLVVGEATGANATLAMINFRILEDRVRFDVQLDPVEKAGLKISSRMLSVANSVSKGSAS